MLSSGQFDLHKASACTEGARRRFAFFSLREPAYPNPSGGRSPAMSGSPLVCMS